MVPLGVIWISRRPRPWRSSSAISAFASVISSRPSPRAPFLRICVSACPRVRVLPLTLPPFNVAQHLFYACVDGTLFPVLVLGACDVAGGGERIGELTKRSAHDGEHHVRILARLVGVLEPLARPDFVEGALACHADRQLEMNVPLQADAARHVVHGRDFDCRRFVDPSVQKSEVAPVQVGVSQRPGGSQNAGQGAVSVQRVGAVRVEDGICLFPPRLRCRALIVFCSRRPCTGLAEVFLVARALCLAVEVAIASLAQHALLICEYSRKRSRGGDPEPREAALADALHSRFAEQLPAVLSLRYPGVQC